MKIFNNENGKKVVYVQLIDLALLPKDSDNGYLESVWNNIFCEIFILTDENKYEFKRFDEEHEVEFFEKLDWIIDYKKVKDLNEEQVIDYAWEIGQEMNVYAEQINALENANKVDHYELFTRYELLRFKYLSLRDVLWFKQGHLEMPFPVVPDSDQIYTVDDKHNLCAYVGLNPQQLLIAKSDNTPFTTKDDIDDLFIRDMLNDLIKNNQDNNEYFNEFEISDYYTDDNMYYVSALSIKTEKKKEEVKEEVKEDKKEKTEKKGIRYLLSLIRKK